MGAMFSVAVMAGSLWFGTLASQEMSGEYFPVASQQDITQLDFNNLDFNNSDVDAE
jgi:hypothetical protein